MSTYRLKVVEKSSCSASWDLFRDFGVTMGTKSKFGKLGKVFGDLIHNFPGSIQDRTGIHIKCW